MDMTFPFFSNQLDDAGSAIYHTHPRCRVAQHIPAGARVMGTGESRGECPFCFLLAQFQANRALRGNVPMGPKPALSAGSTDVVARPLRAFAPRC